MRAVLAVVLVALAAAPLHADPGARPAPIDAARGWAWHAGLDVRTDLGTHAVRIPVGVRTGRWDATLVLDPLFFYDRQHDLDVLVEWYAGERLALLAGWRWSIVQVAGGLHQQQRSLIGVTAIGPSFARARIRTSASLELATLWVRYGGGADTAWINGDRSLADSFALGLFVRLEVGGAL